MNKIIELLSEYLELSRNKEYDEALEAMDLLTEAVKEDMESANKLSKMVTDFKNNFKEYWDHNFNSSVSAFDVRIVIGKIIYSIKYPEE